MTPLLKKIMAMARKTGDRCIIVDSSGEDAFVLMELASYEALLNRDPSFISSISSGSLGSPDSVGIAQDDSPRVAPANRLTAFSNAYNIKPVIRKESENIPFEAFGDDGGNLAELSEEKIRQEERFHLEPL